MVFNLCYSQANLSCFDLTGLYGKPKKVTYYVYKDLKKSKDSWVLDDSKLNSVSITNYNESCVPTDIHMEIIESKTIYNTYYKSINSNEFSFYITQNGNKIFEGNSVIDFYKNKIVKTTYNIEKDFKSVTKSEYVENRSLGTTSITERYMLFTEDLKTEYYITYKEEIKTTFDKNNRILLSVNEYEDFLDEEKKTVVKYYKDFLFDNNNNSLALEILNQDGTLSEYIIKKYEYYN